MNCAASVDFNAQLIDAININVRGTLRMMELARQTKNLENFVHVSTCYVNSDKRGWIEEEIYKSERNARHVFEELNKLSPADLEKQTKTILGLFPNTYVYTKNLVERIMLAERPEKMTITIVRPSIIGASLAEPRPGWVEGVTAASAVFLLTGIGMIKHLHANPDSIGDIIPVDIVSNEVIVTGALCANTNTLNVFNCGTSSRNPHTWKMSKLWNQVYWENHPPEKRLSKPSIALIPGEKMLRFQQVMRRVPALLYLKATNIIGSENMKKDANRFLKVINLTSLPIHLSMRSLV